MDYNILMTSTHHIFIKFTMSLFLLMASTLVFGQVDNDFESGAAGWSNQGTPTTGNWTIGNPRGTNWQLEDDHTPGGVNALYTAANNGGADGTDDVDGGTSILQSPTYNITSNSTLSVWYFFGQRNNGDDAGDFFRLEYSLNGGTNYTTLVFIGDVTTIPVWTNATAQIPAGSNVILRVSAADGNAVGDIIEAGIDDLSIVPNIPIINVEDVVVNEFDGTATFTVTHDNFPASGPFTVDYSTVDGIAEAVSDYTANSGTLSFNGTPGDTEQIVVNIINDLDIEATENFSIQFSNPSDFSVDISDSATGTIIDDEIILNDTPLVLFDEFNGYFDYSVSGGSFRDQDNATDACSITPTSSATGLTTPIPGTATIKKAFLLWAHSNQNPDTQVVFEGQTVDADIVYSSSLPGNLLFYGMMSDVTTLISGIANPSTNVYDMSGLNIDNTDTFASYCGTATTLGGWSLIVFYEELSLPAVSVNMYHGFKGESNTSNAYTLDGFFAIGSSGAKTSVLSWEGDNSLDGNSAGTTNPNGESLIVTNQLGTNFNLMGDGGQTGNNAYNSTIFDNTILPNINTTTSYGVDLDTYDISSFIAPADSQITVGVNSGQDFVIANLVLVKVPSNLIVGTVFEDLNYGGGAGRDLATSGGTGLEGITIELYDSSNNYLESTTTDASGEYSLGGMANGLYSVRVVNGTVSSSRVGGASCSSCLPIQTYRRNYTSGVGFEDIANEVGGADPAGTDSPPFTLTNAQTVATISIASEGVVGLDFGFNFNTIVNTNEDGQGSLEQFIVNSNNLDETGLDIEANSIFDPSAGDDTSIFMIPPTGDALGRTADVNFANGYFNITISNGNPLSNITGDNTHIDGRTQTAYSGNSNTGSIGSGGAAVGIAGNILPIYDLPEIQVYRPRGDVLKVQGDNTTIRNLAVYANNNAGIRIQNGSASILNNLVGVNAIGAAVGGIDSGIEITGGTAIIDGNYISDNTDQGIWINGGTSTLIQNNEITSNGDGACNDNIRIQNGSGVVITQNVISNAASFGIELENTSAGITVTENTIINSGQNGGNCSGSPATAGINIVGSNSSITNNIIASNAGAGIILAGGNTSGNLISQNSTYANGTASAALGIDILGDGVTLNDAGDSDNGPNESVNFPVITSTFVGGGTLTVRGWARPGATIEWFLTDINEGTATAGDNQLGFSTDYGEGQTYLGTSIEGSASDLDSTSSSYTDDDGNTDTTNKFHFVVSIPPGVQADDLITSTATIANSTSEFSPFSMVKIPTVITNKKITYRVKPN